MGHKKKTGKPCDFCFHFHFPVMKNYGMYQWVLGGYGLQKIHKENNAQNQGYI